MKRHRTSPGLLRRSRPIAIVLLAWICSPSLAEDPPAQAQEQATSPAPAPAQETGAAIEPALSRADAFTEFRRLFDAKQYEQAIAPAKRVVELTDPSSSTGSEELQVALMNLATAQYHAADYLGAEASYLRVIELLESSGAAASARLGRANAGLAMTYHAARRHDLAAERFERAIMISRRTEGLFNEHQLTLLEKEADSLSELDRMQEAAQARRYALRVVERRHGAGSLRYAEELESIGRWYTRARAYDAARQALRQAMLIIEATEGENSRRLIGPLTALADNARRSFLDPAQRAQASVDEERRAAFHDPALPVPASLSASTFIAEGQSALERAVAIASAGADPSPVQVAETQTQLGDWLQWREREEAALPHYEQAWQVASRAQVDGKPLNEVLFAQPALLYHGWSDSWDRYRDRPDGEAELRHIEMVLTVTAQGGIEDAKVVADAGDPQLAEQALRAVATARFRPRMEDGRPVATTGVRISQPVYVLVAAPAESAPAKPAPAAEAEPEAGRGG